MRNIKKAIKELKKGNFVLLHDSSERENETDLIIAAEFVSAKDIAKMRQEGGGLICIAIHEKIAKKLSLPFLTDLEKFLSEKFSVLKALKADDIPYDEKSSFSITINHRKTFTGISDEDRALTISEFGKFCKKLPENPTQELGKIFRSPGHVPLLISSGIENREGHTELSTALLKIANLTPIVAICEMLDSETHKSLTKEKAIRYGKKNNLVFLEGNEIKKRWQKLG